MLITIDENDNRPMYRQIADGIRLSIVSGELKENDHLPSVRQLASDLGVNLNTVATAYRELQNDGLLTVKHGAGAVVSSRTTTVKPNDELRKPLRVALTQMLLSGLTWAEIMNLVVDEMSSILKEGK